MSCEEDNQLTTSRNHEELSYHPKSHDQIYVIVYHDREIIVAQKLSVCNVW